MQPSTSTAWIAVEEPGLILVGLASIATVVASIVALICCCHGPTKKDRKNNRDKTAEEKSTPGVAVVLVTPVEASEGEALSRAAEGYQNRAHGNATLEPLIGNEYPVPANCTQIPTPDAPSGALAATVPLSDNQNEGTSAGADKSRDFSTIRNARVNVKLALAAYETGQVLGSSTPAENPILRAPRKKLDAAFKDQIIIRPGRPNIQRHTVAADTFQVIEDDQEVTESGIDDHSKQEATKVLPDLLAVTPRRTSGVNYLSPAGTGGLSDSGRGAGRTPTDDDRKSSGSRSSEAEKDYFGVVQRQDAVLRSVEKVKAPHKHRKGKVPTVDGVQAASVEGLDDFHRVRPHSSGDILD